MGKDIWAEVIEYLRTSNRDPKKTLKLLKGNEKGHQSNYNINRSSYTLNIIAAITQKTLDPKNKNKNLSRVIRDWVKSEDFKNFYNLMRSEEKLKWSMDKVPKYVKQINDLWSKPNQQHWIKYFKMTGGYFLVGEENKKLKNKSISSNLFKLERDK